MYINTTITIQSTTILININTKYKNSVIFSSETSFSSMLSRGSSRVGNSGMDGNTLTSSSDPDSVFVSEIIYT